MSAGNERGQSMVEFALVVPLLLMIITAMVSFGITIQNSLALTNAVNSGAELLSASRGQTTDPCATATTAIEAAAPNLTASKLSFTYVINGSSYSSTSCASATSNMVQNGTAEVTVTYPCVLSGYGLTFPSCTLSTQTAEIIQ